MINILATALLCLSTLGFVGIWPVPASLFGMRAGTPSYVVEAQGNSDEQVHVLKRPRQDMPTVNILETQVDMSPEGATSSDCMEVLPDGHSYLRRRRQPFPGSTGTSNTFESRLSDEQFDELRTILGDSKIKQLPQFASPATPMIAHWFEYFVVQIKDESGAKTVGYFVWRGDGPPGSSPVSTPDSIKKAWQDSQAALQPLNEWFHRVQDLKLRSSRKELRRECIAIP